MSMLYSAIAVAGMKAMQINAQNKAAVSEAEAAVARTNLMYQQQAQEQEEIQAEAGLAMTNEARTKLRERGAMQAASAESGVAGASPLRALANVYMQEAFNTGTIVSKEEALLRSSGMKSQQTYLEGVSAVNAADAKISSDLSAVLQIGVAGASTYAMAGGFSPAAAPGLTPLPAGGMAATGTAATTTTTTSSLLKPNYWETYQVPMPK